MVFFILAGEEYSTEPLNEYRETSLDFSVCFENSLSKEEFDPLVEDKATMYFDLDLVCRPNVELWEIFRKLKDLKLEYCDGDENWKDYNGHAKLYVLSR